MVVKMKQRIFLFALAMCLCISSKSVAYAQQEVPSPTEVYEAIVALKDQDAYKEGTTWTDDEPYSDSLGYYHWQGGTLDGKNISAVGCVAFAFKLSDAAFGSLPARMYASGGFTFEDIKAGDILRVSNDTHTVIVIEVSDAGVIVAEGNHSGKVHWGRAISKEVVMSDTSHYITRYPEGYVSPEDPEANVSIAMGTLEGGITWNLTKAGTLTILGEGVMPDFSSTSDQPWSENSSQIRKVVIGDGVTHIGACAFWNCGVLSAEISSGVTGIGNSAFRGTSIISVAIPSGVKNIGDSAFRECQNLSSVTVCEGLEIINPNAFRSCTGLISISLPASVGEVGDAAFFQCTAMTSATFASGSKQVKLGDNLFTQCYALMGVTLPRNIDCIGEGMFQNCRMLAGVEVPQGAESIGGSAFASSGVSVVLIPDSVKTMGIAAFSACPLSDIYYTGTEEQWNSISKIGDTASAVSKVTIHYNYVPDITPAPDDGENGDNEDNNTGDNTGGSDNSGNGGSSGSGSNTGDSDNSGSGEKTESGKGQASGQKPFAKGKIFTISKVTYKVTKAGKEVELITSKSTAKKVMVNTVKGTDGVKYKVTAIGSKAMKNNKKMTSLTIGVNVKKIGKNAFLGCKKLGKVTIRSTKLSSVGKQAFKGTKSSLKVKVPSRQLAKYKKILKKAGLKAKQITK